MISGRVGGDIRPCFTPNYGLQGSKTLVLVKLILIGCSVTGIWIRENRRSMMIAKERMTPWYYSLLSWASNDAGPLGLP